MDIGPIDAERAIADTRHLVKEGFFVATVKGAKQDCAWNFLFETRADCACFQKSMAEIAVLYREGRVADVVIVNIALSYDTIRYTFETPKDALRFLSWNAAMSSAH
jgi:hypothetical protein